MKKALKKTVKIAGVLVGIHNRIFVDISGLSGNISGLSGDVDDCEISDSEREYGVNIAYLIGD